jgi:membrane-associated protein
MWVASITSAGFIFGNLPVIQRNFHVVIIAIIVISILPMVLTWLKAKNDARRASVPGS